MIPLETVAYISAIVLALAAIVGGILAYKNIGVLREQHRRNTFLSLMNELSTESARRKREIIHQCIEPEADGQYPADIPPHRVWNLIPLGGTQIGSKGVRDAIQETVDCLDKVGYFLLRGDPKLIDEAPLSVWMITNEMWEKLSNYVKNQQQSHYAWGKYFEELANEGLKRYAKSKKDPFYP